MPTSEEPSAARRPAVPVARIGRAWFKIGLLGFGGPPAHIALLRQLVVEREQWIDADEFEDVVAVTSLLPGPASTQTAVLSAWLIGGLRGALVGAAGFILPGLVAVIALATVLLAAAPPPLVLAIAAGAGAAVPAVALAAGAMLIAPSRQRAAAMGHSWRWTAYVAAGVTATIVAGPFLVLCLLACGFAELLLARRGRDASGGPGDEPAGGDADGPASGGAPPLRRRAAEGATLIVLPFLAAIAAPGTALALAWMGLKIGALSYGGGFVIVPMMQADAVAVHGWLSDAQFLSAVAIGQVVPGPVVNTGAAIGWAAAGVPGALLVATAIFAPAIAIALAAGRSLHRLRSNPRAAAFLAGAAPAAIGAILGSCVPLALILQTGWQVMVMVAAGAALLGFRFPVPLVLLAGGLLGAAAWQAGLALPS